MSSPAHQIIEQQRQLVSELRNQLAAPSAGSREQGDSDVQMKLVEAETQLTGMERIFNVVFGSGAGPR